MKNADRIRPEWQHRELGETVHLHPAGGLGVSVFEPGRALGLEGWGTFALELLGAGRTRPIALRRLRPGAQKVSTWASFPSTAPAFPSGRLAEGLPVGGGKRNRSPARRNGCTVGREG